MVAASTRQRRTPGRHYRGQSVTHITVNNDRAKTGPSGQTTVAPTSDADEVTAAGAANGQSNPVEAADDPAPDAEPGLTAEEMRKEVRYRKSLMQRQVLTFF
jgi:activator of HSP90 ATPase